MHKALQIIKEAYNIVFSVELFDKHFFKSKEHFYLFLLWIFY
jgi:hypothetical protein